MLAFALVALFQVSSNDAATDRIPVHVAFVSEIPAGEGAVAILRDPTQGDAILMRANAEAEDFDAGVQAYIALRARDDSEVEKRALITVQPASRRELTPSQRSRIDELFGRIRAAEAKELAGFGLVRQVTIYVRRPQPRGS